MYRKWFFTLVLTCLLPFGAAGQWHTSNQYHFDNAIQFLPLAMELGLGFCTPADVHGPFPGCRHGISRHGHEGLHPEDLHSE